MRLEILKSLYKHYKEPLLFGRYIHHESIASLLKKLHGRFAVKSVGQSVNGLPIYTVTFGQGAKKILMWSQMHGNESTTTKAVFDLLNTCSDTNELSRHILSNCTITIIPILNPDGAKAYTRLNANNVDLNRDAQDMSQPESVILRQVFEEFKPHYCYNLHGQRTIFSAGDVNYPATVSFLAPAQDEARSLTETRKIAMEIISVMNANLQLQIKNQVGLYDDGFNINCVGDTFQSLGVPTVLFEAGHFPNDYNREQTREYIYQSLLCSLEYIAENDIDGSQYAGYFGIPMNKKLFYDILIRNSKSGDIAIQYQERLVDGILKFIPKVEKISMLNNFYGYKEINANGYEVFGANGISISVGSEIDFVTINNEEILINL